jgi:hypothetical protein
METAPNFPLGRDRRSSSLGQEASRRRART